MRTLVPAAGGRLRTQEAQFLDLSAVHVDGGVLAFGLALSLLTGTLCGVVPALRASRPRLGDALKAGEERLAALLADCDPYVEPIGEYDVEYLSTAAPYWAAARQPGPLALSLFE